MNNNTYLLTKGIFNIENAAKFFDTVKQELPPRARNRHKLAVYVQRLRWIIQDILTTVPAEMAQQLRSDFTGWDTLAFESVFDEMLQMDPEQRAVMEEAAKAIRAGNMQLAEAGEIDNLRRHLDASHIKVKALQDENNKLQQRIANLKKAKSRAI